MTDTITNWNELDYSIEANRTMLNYAVAEARGYQFIPQHVNGRAKPHRYTWKIVFPDGGVEYVQGWFTKDQLYDCVKYRIGLPDWADDLEHADALMDDTPGISVWTMGVERGLEGDPNTYNVTGIANSKYAVVKWHVDKCIVRCLAYLAYVEWRKAQQVQP